MPKHDSAITAVETRAELVLRNSLGRLRFESPLEAEFRKDYEDNSIGFRLVLFFISLVSVVLTPVYDWLLLHPPQAYVPVARLIQFGIETPPLVMGLLCCWLPSLRRFVPAVILLASLTTCGGLYAQRVYGAGFGYAVPFDFAATTIAGVFTLARLRFDVFFPWALAMVVAVCALEIHFFGANSASYFNCISLVIMFAIFSTAGFLLERTARENWYRRRQLSTLAMLDPLTGLPNRRHFDTMLVQVVRAASRERGSVALMLIDIDDFKAYNDRHGHPAGDVCLSRIGQWLANQMRRPNDFCARIGGEEFVAVWSNAKPADARRLAENLLAGIAALGIAHEHHGNGGVVTASGGFAEVIAPHPEEAARGIAKLMVRRADDLLYRAKKGGRNRLIFE